MIGTTITDMSSRQIKLLYKLRWGVETSFKRKKSYLNLNNIYARSEKLWKQEIQVRILYDTLLIRTQSKTEKIKRKHKSKTAYCIIKLNSMCYLLDFKVNLIARFNM